MCARAWAFGRMYTLYTLLKNCTHCASLSTERVCLRVSACLSTQALWTAAVATSQSVVPGMLGGAVGVATMALEEAQRLPASWRGLRQSLSAWTATLLFMTMAIPQLMNNLRDPASTVALSVPTILLGMLGNGLMVPRALFTRDLIWFCGSTWGAAVMGWAQIVTVARAGFLPPEAFAAITAAIWSYLAAILWVDCAAHGHRSPRLALHQMLHPKLP